MEKVKLSEFLKENNCYEKFIKNFDKKFVYEGWIKIENLDRVISFAFEWDRTKEGFNYWNAIDGKWREINHKENDMVDFFEDKDNIDTINTKEENMTTEELVNLLTKCVEVIPKDDIVKATKLINNIKKTNETLFDRVLELEGRLEDVKTVFGLEFSY